MTTVKRVLCERRLRRIPAQFSWVDQRLVLDGHLAHCDALGAALYLLLVTVADCQGLSYWGDARVARVLSCSMRSLEHARGDLLRLGLIAYERPLYQVLALDRATPTSEVAIAPPPIAPPPIAPPPIAPPPIAPPPIAPPPIAPTSTVAPSAAPHGVDHEAIRHRLAQVRAKLVGS